MKKKKIVYYMLFMTVLIIYGINNKSTAKASSYINDIKIETGQNAQSKLEEAGYTVMSQKMNISEQSDDNISTLSDKAIVYMGYKAGSDNAITDMIISQGKDKESEITVNGINYQLASDVNLNCGTDGDKVYLYITRDKNAGDDIVDICMTSNQGEEAPLKAVILNDGSYPVYNTNGKVGNFDSGRNDIALYVYMIRKNICKPYISDVKVFVEESRSKAIEEIANNGYIYFVDDNLSEGTDKYTYIGFNRTAEKKSAITGLVFSKDNAEELKTSKASYKKCCESEIKINGKDLIEGYLYYTKEESVGKPIVKILKSISDDASFTLGEIVKFEFTSITGLSSVYVQNESEYNELKNDKTEEKAFLVEFAGKKTKTGLVFFASGDGLKDNFKETETTMSTSEAASQASVTEAVPTAEASQSVDNKATDGQVSSQNDVSTTASIMSKGLIIIPIAIIIVIVAIVWGIIYKRKMK